MKNLKKLSRNQLIMIQGGDTPSGTYVCCLNSHPNVCSTPVTHDHESGAGDLCCSSGSSLKKVKALSANFEL